MAVGRDFLLASPLTVFARLCELAVTAQFWRAALYTCCRILLGYLLGATAGAGCAGLAARCPRFGELIAPLIAVLRAIPVASYVVVALIWLPSRNLSVLISFLIVFPVLYGETGAQIGRTNPQLAEMAQLFRMSPGRKLVYLYLLPALREMGPACASAMGLAWKSGVAAELISIPAGSIGEQLYQAKVYLMTGDLFAWTILIILLSAACARLFAALMRFAAARLEGV